MIDLVISISFSIINLTEFEWQELQQPAQKIVDDYALHTIPDNFEFTSQHIVTHRDQDLSVFLRYSSKSVEVLFVQPSLLKKLEIAEASI